MITYISLSSDKKYINIDVNVEPAIKIHLKDDVIISKHDNKIEYRITGTNCRIILIKDIAYSTNECTIGQMEIHSDSMIYIDRYEDYDDPNATETMLSVAIETYSANH
jgi:hypothetical protein